MKTKYLKTKLFFIFFGLLVFIFLLPTNAYAAFDNVDFSPRFNYTQSEETQINEKLNSGELNPVMELLYQDSTTYYRETLSDLGKQFYDILLEKIKTYDYNTSLIYSNGRNFQSHKFNVKIPISYDSTTVLETTQKALNAVLTDHKEYFFYSGYSLYKTSYINLGLNYNYEIEVKLEIYSNYVTGNKYSPTLLRDTQKFITNLYQVTKTARNLPRIIKIRYFHDWLVSNNNYNVNFNTPLQHSPISALTDFYLPVCEGYAEALQVLFNASGINGVYAVGAASSGNSSEFENHAWNYVAIDNKLYMIDTTWDDPTSNTPNYLKDWDSSYNYFLTKTPVNRYLFQSKDGDWMYEYNPELYNYIKNSSQTNYYQGHQSVNHSFIIKPQQNIESNIIYQNKNITNPAAFYQNLRVKIYNIKTGELHEVTNLQSVSVPTGDYLLVADFKNKTVNRTIACYTFHLNKNTHLSFSFNKQDVKLINGKTDSQLTALANTNLSNFSFFTTTSLALNKLSEKLNEVGIPGYKALEFRLKNNPGKTLTNEDLTLLDEKNYELVAVYAKLASLVFSHETTVYLYDFNTVCEIPHFTSSDSFSLDNVPLASNGFEMITSKVKDLLTKLDCTFYQLYFVANKTLLTEQTITNFEGTTPIEFGLILDFDYIVRVNDDTIRFSRKLDTLELFTATREKLNLSHYLLTGFKQENKTELDLNNREKSLVVVPQFLNLNEPDFLVSDVIKYEYLKGVNTLVIPKNSTLNAEDYTTFLKNCFAKKNITVSNVTVLDKDNNKQIKCLLLGDDFISQELTFNLSSNTSPTPLSTRLNIPVWAIVIIVVGAVFATTLVLGLILAYRINTRRRH